MFSILSVLLIGAFMGQVDGCIMMATYGLISSEFNQLENATWLLSSYMLAACVSQPLYGKLSDIFGRKPLLQISYLLFTLGCLLCGLSQSMAQMIAARAIQGIGGAGMGGLVAILISDLVPLRDVAVYRSYVNVVQTVGRSCGGPIGGALMQTIGWRWAFLGQVPIILIAMCLIEWKLESPERIDDSSKESLWEKFRSIDFLGVATLSLTILSSLLILDLGGTMIPWNSPLIPVLVTGMLLCGGLFIVTEKYWAKQPIFPLSLLTHYDVFTSYLILMFQSCSQIALMSIVPLYFTVTQNASPAAAGSYMTPSIIGNTIGGLGTGAYIKRSGRYKLPIIISGISACSCFTILATTWRGNTSLWEALLIFPAGFSSGIGYSATFIAMGAGIDEKDMAIATSGLYLSSNVGAVAGVSLSSALFHNTLRTDLNKVLKGVEGGKEIARKALSDIDFVQKLKGRLHALVIEAYVYSFSRTFTLSLAFSACALLVGWMIREKRIKG
ncbi:MFS general substrate transporter [Eremomyces bilateralis CBS 781.70]|uniref:MFS general substrate transporter n=1 Tax=Eremomyces bilateralis CBS 781.70 TaxID=1392243 RepID=A0A6G1G7A5_9PEZI|nr:MFS general substrate transporter [Eremomyces bilateralis CBS 781.70]KAF1813933.1 MFS general substrate transporter [Eremomyces bilateralis CBS 781.70]